MANDKMVNKQLRLLDGTIVRLCPTDKPLYCSRDGRFFSVHNAILTDDGWILHELKPNWTYAMAHFKGGSCYPLLRSYVPHMCHTLVALTWLGPRPPILDPYGNILGYMEIDHLNGNILDFSADNLQYVTPAENRRRARILRTLRAQALATNRPDLLPQNMRPDDLLALFTKNNLAGDCYEGV